MPVLQLIRRQMHAGLDRNSVSLEYTFRSWAKSYVLKVHYLGKFHWVFSEQQFCCRVLPSRFKKCMFTHGHKGNPNSEWTMQISALKIHFQQENAFGDGKNELAIKSAGSELDVMVEQKSRCCNTGPRRTPGFIHFASVTPIFVFRPFKLSYMSGFLTWSKSENNGVWQLYS